jgi:hypothetical protein
VLDTTEREKEREVASSPRCNAQSEENRDGEVVVAKIDIGDPSSGRDGSPVRLDPVTREGGPGAERPRVREDHEGEEGKEIEEYSTDGELLGRQ